MDRKRAMTLYIDLPKELEQAVLDAVASCGCSFDEFANVAVARYLRDAGEDIAPDKCELPKRVQS